MEGRIITTKEVSGGVLKDFQIARMREINLAPAFNKKEKPWTLVKIPKSSTKNVAWIVKMQEDYYLITQVCLASQYVTVYKSNSKGKIENWSTDKVKDYMNYVDLETAVDIFYNEAYPQNEEEQPTITESATEAK